MPKTPLQVRIKVMPGIWKRTPNGNFYTRENMKQAIDEFNERPLRLGYNYTTWEQANYNSLSMPVDQASHTIEKLEIQGDDIYATIKVLPETECGSRLKHFIAKKAHIDYTLHMLVYPTGRNGIMKTEKIISGYAFLSE